jgi:iron complex outermembrane recepter protein
MPKSPRFPAQFSGYRALVASALSLFLSFGILTPSWATDSSQQGNGGLAQLSLEQLGNVEVTTVSKEPEEVWQTPAAIYVLTQEDIRRSGATTIPEALRLVPGVEVARIDSDHWSIGVRGFGSGFSKSVLVLIDGRSVYTPLFAGVYWDVQDTLLEDVERIEVIRGPGGTIWGSNAVNGVINIITKNAKDTHGTLASVSGGDLDKGEGEIRQGGEIGDSLDYRVYGKAFARGPELHPEDPNYDDWSQERGGFRMDWDKGSNDTLNFQGDIYHGDDGEITSVGSFSPPSQITLAGNDIVSGGDLMGRWQHNFAGGSDIQIQTYYDRTDRHALQYGETRNTFDVDFLYHRKWGNRQNILLGTGLRVSPSHFTQTIPGLNFTANHQTDSIYSGFAQDEIQIVKQKLSLTLGTKLEDNSFNGFDIQPSARLLWTPRLRQSFWAAVTRAVRTPSRLDTDLELFEYLGNVPNSAVQVYLEVTGDPTFAPEQLLGYEAGYRQLITPKFYVDFSAFDNKYDDLASYGPGTSAVKTTPLLYLLLAEPYANGIKGTTEGFEVAPSWSPTNWWQLKGSYSYLHLSTQDKPGFTDTGTVAMYNGSSPHDGVVIQSLLNLPKRFEFDLTYRYVSALPAQDVSAYSTVDARVGWHTGDFEFSLDGQNLLQPEHGEFGNTPGPVVGIRRTVYAKVTWVHKPS